MLRAGIASSDKPAALLRLLQEEAQDGGLGASPAPDHRDKNRVGSPRQWQCYGTPALFGKRQARNEGAAHTGFHKSLDRCDATELTGDFRALYTAGRKGTLEHLSIYAAPLRDQERLACEISARNCRPPGKSVAGRYDNDHARPAHGDMQQVWFGRDSVEHEAHIELTAPHPAPEHAAASNLQTHLDARIAITELGQQRRQPVCRERLKATNRDQPSMFVGCDCNSGPCLVSERQDLARMFEQALAGRGQSELASRPVEERCSKVGFKDLDLLRDARRSKANLLGGTCEVQPGSGRYKGSQMPKVHASLSLIRGAMARAQCSGRLKPSA